MDRGTHFLNPAQIDPGALVDLVDELREAGYHVGPDQYVAAQDVVLALAARGGDLEADRLRSMLGPLLCCTPWEQEDFGERIESWALRLALKSVKPEDGPIPESGNGPVRRRWRLGARGLRWATTFSIAATLLALAALYVHVQGPLVGLAETHLEKVSIVEEAIEAPGAPPTSWWSRLLLLELHPNWPAWLALATVFVALGSIWWRWRARLFLSRWAVQEKPQLQRVVVDGLRGQLFHGVSLARTARDLRKRRKLSSRDLDVSLTVSETVRQAGWLVPVYAPRQLVPEYLMLVDRASYRDQQAKFVDTIIDRLRATDVLISRYYFDADPRICFSFARKASPVALRELASRYPNYHLLVFSDAAGLFNSRTGDLEPWAEQFSSWSNRAILTPVPRAHWGPREAVLLQQFSTLPATPAGLAGLVRKVGRGEVGEEERAAARFPSGLQTRPLRWLGRRAPADRVVESTLVEVRRYLGEKGFYWLAACAVYPALDWNLTLYLGNRLQVGGHRLLQLRRLTALARLPWFRHGYMPDWLRQRVLERISADQQQEIRAALESLLGSVERTRQGGFSLQIARGKLLARWLAGRGGNEGALEDYVFATVMAGRRLSVMVPRTAGEHLRRWLEIVRNPPLRMAELAGLALLVGLLLLLGRIPGLLNEAPPSVQDPPRVVRLDAIPSAVGTHPAPPQDPSVMPAEEPTPAPIEDLFEPSVGEDSVLTVVDASQSADTVLQPPFVEPDAEPSDSSSVETEDPPPLVVPPSVIDLRPPLVITDALDRSDDHPPPPSTVGAVKTEDGEPPAAPVSADKAWRETFVMGMRAFDHREWQMAADLMQTAQGHKAASGELIRVRGFREVPYLPHYYRGFAFQKLGRCEEALLEWTRSEEKGFVESHRRQYKRLIKYRSECLELSRE